MKSLFKIIAATIAIALVSAISANAQDKFDPNSFTPQGVENLVRYLQRSMKTDARVSNIDGTGVRFSDEVIDGYIEYLDMAQKYLGADITLSKEEMNQVIAYLLLMKESDSRLYIYQKSNGSLGAIRHDRAFWSPQVGAIYNGQGIRPYVAVAYGKDGAHMWRDKKGHAVPFFGYEVGGFLYLTEYMPGAYSAGKKYLSYGVDILGKLQLFESKWVRHRLNLVGGAMYAYYQDDTQISEKQREFFEASGIFVTGGLEYRWRTKDKGGNTILIRGMVNWQPWSQLNVTGYNMTGQVVIGYTFGQNYKIR